MAKRQGREGPDADDDAKTALQETTEQAVANEGEAGSEPASSNEAIKAITDLLQPLLQPVFLEPLDDIEKDTEAEQKELLKVNWKLEQDGWVCVKTVPDTGAEISVGPEEMAPGYAI